MPGYFSEKQTQSLQALTEIAKLCVWDANIKTASSDALDLRAFSSFLLSLLFQNAIQFLLSPKNSFG